MREFDKDLLCTIKNTVMLYILSFVKLVLPLITIPYLTRVLSKEVYGLVSYVKASMIYMQLIIDFGFMLSSVREIVSANGDKEQIGLIAGHTYLAKTLLIGIAFVVMVCMCISMPILKQNIAYTLMSFAAVAVSAYLADFLFRGIEKMHIITILFVISRLVATSLTFILIQGDADIMAMPVIDIISTLVSIVLSYIWLVKLGIKIRVKSIYSAIHMLKDSFTYFISNMATTVFSALNTILIGIVIVDLQQIAYWGLCIQIISAIQGLYTPITNGIYPHMIKKKSLNFIHRVMFIIMPVVLFGCVLCIILSKTVMIIVGGSQYIEAHNVFRCLVPILFFSFPAQLYGWPTLGAVGLIKETSMSTIVAAVVQLVGLTLLIVMGQMNLYTMAILKSVVEICLMLIRMVVTYRNSNKFCWEH